MENLSTLPGFQASTASAPTLPLQGLTHDLRNLMASLALCIEELAKPGVLASGHTSLAEEMQSLTSTSLRIVGQMSETMQVTKRALIDPEGVEPSRALAWEAGVAGSEEWSEQKASSELAGEESFDLFFLRLGRLLTVLAGPQIRFTLTRSACRGRLTMRVLDLERVLVNLVQNAKEAMPQGGKVNIHAQMAVQKASGRPVIEITVQDNGPGIDPAIADRIFESGFTTRDNSSQGSEAHTASPQLSPDRDSDRRSAVFEFSRPRGQGLSIAQRLIQSSGGRIQLVSTPVGARFQLEVPVALVTSTPRITSANLQKGSAI